MVQSGAKRMKGERRPDGTTIFELKSGEYAKLSEREWWFKTPNGIHIQIFTDDARYHKLAVEPDGTVSLTPSLLCRPGSCGIESGWHGYLTKGVWTEC
jgi:hypothetical protein